MVQPSHIAPPSISVSLSIDPPSFVHGADCNISVTATLHWATPITIFTWPTIFNLQLAQKRHNFYCLDADNGSELRLDISKGPKRPGFTDMLGGRDDRYFQTLEPETPMSFISRFMPATRTIDPARDEAGLAMTHGHRYRFGVRESENVDAWWEGRKEDVMSRPDRPADLLGQPKNCPIRFDRIEPVEFELRRVPILSGQAESRVLL